MNQKIENIIVKFLMNTANIEELEALTDWLKKPKNKQYFKNYARINYAMDINMNQFDTENAKKKYLRKIKQDKSVFLKLRLYNISKYAAAAVIFFGLGYFFKDNIFNTSVETTPIIVNTNIIEPGSDKATLTLEDGSIVALEKGDTYETQNAISNGDKIVYKKDNLVELVFNYLTVPRGGQFYIELSDGTKVWLNSESQLKYPVNFLDGKTRQVELVYGEAYFDVSPSTEHKGAKFKVINQSQEVEVFGTEFNIKAYKDEVNIYTTLIEGKVAVSTNSENRILIPNQQSNVNIKNKDVKITNVDVNTEIAWIKGDFIFQYKSLNDIMTVLSRWYDVDFKFENKSIADVVFNGELSKYQNLEEILILIKNTNYINDYEINKKTVILK